MVETRRKQETWRAYQKRLGKEHEHQYGTSWKNMKNIGAYIEEYRGTWRNKKNTTHGTW